MEKKKILYRGGEGEISEKKSRFIATVRPVSCPEEAQEFIEEMKKKYWDASHNCFAYSIGENPPTERCSDDGEPQGTAGKPILDVIRGEGLHDAAVVVTRYFGGTLLGTGGLVRAYSKAAQEGISACEVIEKQSGKAVTLKAEYTDIGKVQYLIGQRKLAVLESEYADSVILKVLAPTDEWESFRDEITEGTAARTVFMEEKDVIFAWADGEPLIFGL